MVCVFVEVGNGGGRCVGSVDWIADLPEPVLGADGNLLAAGFSDHGGGLGTMAGKLMSKLVLDEEG